MNKDLWQELDKHRGNYNFSNLSIFTKVLKDNPGRFFREDIITAISKSMVKDLVYTPFEIAELMAKLGEINQPRSIIDICCGIGNVLSFCQYGQKRIGIDINHDIIKLAKQLSPDIDFISDDSLKRRFNSKYDLVFCNYPFGVRTKDNGKWVYTESRFVEKSLTLLKPKGVLICIVQNGFLWNSKYQALRRKIIDEYNLKMILNFPSGLFKPNTAIPTSLLYIQNGDKTTKTAIETYKSNMDEIILNFTTQKHELIVNNYKLQDNWNIQLYPKKYHAFEKELSDRETKPLSELANVIRGVNITSIQLMSKGKYLYLRGKNIRNNRFYSTNTNKYITPQKIVTIQKKAILQEGDVVIPLLFSQKKIYIHENPKLRIIASSNFAIIRSSIGSYIQSYLKSGIGQKILFDQIELHSKGATIPHLSTSDIKNFRIPIIPLDNLEKISDNSIEDTAIKELKYLLEEIEQLSVDDKAKRLSEFISERKARITSEISNRDLFLLVSHGESEQLEFKSSLRWCVEQQTSQKELEKEVLKNIAAFCNTKGGTILIGIRDDKTVLGIDLKKENFKNYDAMIQHISNRMNDWLLQPVGDLVEFKFITQNNKKILKIDCKPSTIDIWFKYKNEDELFFYRVGPTAKPLKGRKLIEYVNTHFSKL